MRPCDVVALATVGDEILCVADGLGLIHLFRIHPTTRFANGCFLHERGDLGRHLGPKQHGIHSPVYVGYIVVMDSVEMA